MYCSPKCELIKKTRIDGCHHYPFIGKKVPSINYRYPLLLPFISEINPSGRYKYKCQSGLGFTLIELVVTMAVAAILVAIAVPNMRTFIQNGRISTQTNDLIGDISLARTEAIKRRSGIGICKSTDGLTCAGGGAWRDGRAIFIDINNNNTWEAGETILRFREPLAAPTDTLNVNNLVPDPLIFGTNGSPLNSTGGFFVFCDGRGPTNGKQINVNAMGQTTVVTTAPVTCTPPP